MAGRDHPKLCERCGSTIEKSDEFCGVCGAKVSSAAPTTDTSKQSSYQGALPSFENSRMLVGTVAIGVALVLLISIGVLVYAPSFVSLGKDIVRLGEEEPTPGPDPVNPPIPPPDDSEEPKVEKKDAPKPAPPSPKVQDGQQQDPGQQKQAPNNAPAQPIVDASNQKAGQPVVVVGDNPRPDRVVIRPDVAPRDQVERGALLAAINYYAAAGRGDYAATYRMLANVDKRHYDPAEWIRANRNLDSAAGRYVVHSADTASSNRVYVNVTVYLADG